MTFGVHGSFFDEFVELVRLSYASDDGAPDVAAPSWRTGRLDSKAKSKLPLVHWSRPSGNIAVAEHVGRRDYVASSGLSYWFSARYDDVASVECRIVTENWAQLDCVQSGIIRAARNALGKMSVPGSYEHATESDEDPLAVPGHQVLLQSFEWRYPLVHAWGALTVPTGVASATQQQNEDGSANTAGPAFTQP